jgi:hypothetical protein
MPTQACWLRARARPRLVEVTLHSDKVRLPGLQAVLERDAPDLLAQKRVEQGSLTDLPYQGEGCPAPLAASVLVACTALTCRCPRRAAAPMSVAATSQGATVGEPAALPPPCRQAVRPGVQRGCARAHTARAGEAQFVTEELDCRKLDRGQLAARPSCSRLSSAAKHTRWSSCLRRQAAGAHSHDNLGLHSVPLTPGLGVPLSLPD